MSKSSERGSMTLLVIEDDPIEVKALKRAFSRAGIPVSIFLAGEGEAALKMLREGAVPEPRIVLVDLHMPKMGGLDFLRTLRRDPLLNSEIVFVWTSSGAKEDISSAYGFHVAGYLLKDEAKNSMPDLARMLEVYWNRVELPVRR